MNLPTTLNYQGGHTNLKASEFISYDELPLFLNAEILAKALRISISSCYELLHEKDFPTLMVGNRMVVPKEDFILWVRRRMGGAKDEGES